MLWICFKFSLILFEINFFVYFAKLFVGFFSDFKLQQFAVCCFSFYCVCSYMMILMMRQVFFSSYIDFICRFLQGFSCFHEFYGNCNQINLFEKPQVIVVQIKENNF